jgi:predicted double-glycine peptidase
MVMQYWIRQDTRADTRMAAAADGDRIYRLLAANSEEEISGAALQRYLEDHGFSAFVFNGQLQDFRNHLDKGRPLIVCFAPRGSREPLHYAVIVGMTEKDIFMNDPSRGRLTRESVDHFMRGWKATGNWTLLAVPASPQLR